MIIIYLYVFAFFSILVIFLLDRWIPLISAIIFRDNEYLKDDILESGMCEGKLDKQPPRWISRRSAQDRELGEVADELFREIS